MTNFNGGNLADVVTTGGDNDNINAGGGDNVIAAGQGHNNVNAGSGSDRITSGSGNDNINAGDGNNVIHAGDGRNNVNTGRGDDEIVVGSGDDNINAGDGNNVIHAGDGRNNVNTGIGNDRITSGSGNDNINTCAGNDIVDAGDGWNNVNLGSGNDTAIHGIPTNGFSRYHGDSGLDTLRIVLTEDQMQDAAIGSEIARLTDAFADGHVGYFRSDVLGLELTSFEALEIIEPEVTPAEPAEETTFASDVSTLFRGTTNGGANRFFLKDGEILVSGADVAGRAKVDIDVLEEVWSFDTIRTGTLTGEISASQINVFVQDDGDARVAIGGSNIGGAFVFEFKEGFYRDVNAARIEDRLETSGIRTDGSVDSRAEGAAMNFALFLEEMLGADALELIADAGGDPGVISNLEDALGQLNHGDVTADNSVRISGAGVSGRTFTDPFVSEQAAETFIDAVQLAGDGNGFLDDILV